MRIRDWSSDVCASDLLGAIKEAAAEANAELGVHDADVGEAISSAASEVADGRWDGEFPIDVYQTGSGTSTNMNANEVIASLASERLGRSEEHTSELQSLMRTSYAVFCLKKKTRCSLNT